jgi:hypothetical protein
VPIPPTLFRTVLKANMPDADWAATQVAPAASICINVANVNRIGVVMVARDALGAVSTGNVDLQLVDVANSIAIQSQASRTIVKSAPVDAAVETGDALEYDVSGSSLVTIRVAAQALAVACTYIELYWNALE